MPILWSSGTGKTETVLQIARKTGRDILQIDIAGMRDKYVGESEKNIKAVFQRYRDICKNSDVIPILFFNEADGIFGKRSTSNSINPSVTKMDNAMQNIILQEIEDLEGILIATTNLTCNLDSAFERRFLYKVEFAKPSEEAKRAIWQSMLPTLSESDIAMLATKYDFSGGQIENISRKQTVEEILTGEELNINRIVEFCNAERLGNSSVRPRIGF
jgi:SpoVK/Ycf46/Vps4 family AAA+-type ATPase